MYCSKCGAPIIDEEGSKTEPKKWHWGLKLLTLLAVILLAGWAIITLMQPPEEDLAVVVKGQLSALQEHRITEAYYHYSSKKFQSTVSLETFHHWLEKSPIFLQVYSAQFGQQIINGDVGTLKGILIGRDNVLTTIEAQLVKENGEWKVSKLSLIENEKKAPTASASDTKNSVQIE